MNDPSRTATPDAPWVAVDLRVGSHRIDRVDVSTMLTASPHDGSEVPLLDVTDCKEGSDRGRRVPIRSGTRLASAAVTRKG